MAIERSDQMKRLMERHGLPWVEANEDRCSTGASDLRVFGKNLPEDRADGKKAVERLVSSGRGEATKALQDHWDGFAKKFDRVASAARVIADGLDACGDIIGDTKNAAIDIVTNFQSRIDALKAGDPRWLPEDHTAEEAAEASVAKAKLDPEIASALTRSNERLTLVRNNPDVGSLRDIAGLPESPGAGVGGASGALAPGIGSGGGGSGGGSGQRAFGGDNMQLASAGGWWNDDFRFDHDEHKRAVDSLAKVAAHMRDTTSTELGQAVFDVTELGASGSLGSAIAAGFSPLVDDLVLATRALGNHLTGPLSDAITAAAADQKRYDDEVKKRFQWGG